VDFESDPEMTGSQLKQDLRALRALYNGPEKRANGAFARDCDGNVCAAWSQDAVCWDLYGLSSSLLRDMAVPSARAEECRSMIARCGLDDPRGFGLNLLVWDNDPERTFEDVIALLDKAIEEAL
jgi:hypothetical protein